jgi:hypothetical protein
MKPLFLVCEDGAEYLDRLQRFLGGEFRFQRAQSLAALLAQLQQHQCAGVIMDLDFRRTPLADLIDESGSAARASDQERVAAVQGLFILRALRGRALEVPALLCTDIDDPAQLQHLEAELAPLHVVPSSEGLPRLAQRLRALAAPR